MEEESEIIFSLSKGACQSKSDCEAPREEDIEYFSQTTEYGTEEDPFEVPWAHVTELRCGNGSIYNGWYACWSYPEWLSPPWGEPICRCSESGDNQYMYEGWYEQGGKELAVFFYCRQNRTSEKETCTYGDLSYGWGYLQDQGMPRSADTFNNPYGQDLISILGGGYCCDNECVYCPCNYKVCPMEVGRIDPPYPPDQIGATNKYPNFCVPDGWECLVYKCNTALDPPSCMYVNLVSTSDCGTIVEDSPGFCEGDFGCFRNICGSGAQPITQTDKGICDANCVPPTPTGECRTVTSASIGLGVQCKVIGEPCQANQSCRQANPVVDPTGECNCRSSYLSSRLVEDFNWKGSSPP